METLINHHLSDVPSAHCYDLLDVDFKSGYFAGHIIKNLYDEQRFLINEKYNPQRFTFATSNGNYKLYGILKPTSDALIKQLTDAPPDCIGAYSSALTLRGLSCMTCFLHFSPGLYPIDSAYLHRIFPDIAMNNFNTNKNAPSFQRIGHIYLFALVNHNFSI